MWSQQYPQRLCHSQHNINLSIITSFEQRESLLWNSYREQLRKIHQLYKVLRQESKVKAVRRHRAGVGSSEVPHIEWSATKS